MDYTELFRHSKARFVIYYTINMSSYQLIKCTFAHFCAVHNGSPGEVHLISKSPFAPGAPFTTS